MCEMLEIVKKILLLAGLLYFAWQDYHTHYIGVVLTIIMGLVGIFISFFVEGNVAVIWEVLRSMAIGLGLIFIGVVSKESIGMGDGILFLMSGCYLNVFENMMLLLRTIFLTGGFAILCLLIGRLREKDRIPMAPFMLTAYVTTL